MVCLSEGDTLLALEMVVSGFVLLSWCLLGEVGNDEEDEEEVGVTSLVRFALVV